MRPVAETVRSPGKDYLERLELQRKGKELFPRINATQERVRGAFAQRNAEWIPQMASFETTGSPDYSGLPSWVQEFIHVDTDLTRQLTIRLTSSDGRGYASVAALETSDVSVQVEIMEQTGDVSLGFVDRKRKTGLSVGSKYQRELLEGEDTERERHVKAILIRMDPNDLGTNAEQIVAFAEKEADRAITSETLAQG